jgi:hypothetical protein
VLHIAGFQSNQLARLAASSGIALVLPAALAPAAARSQAAPGGDGIFGLTRLVVVKGPPNPRQRSAEL